MNIPTLEEDIPSLNAAQMIEVDRTMMVEYHIVLIQMMENAGHCLATLARERFLNGSPTGKHITVMAGKGGNGGGSLVAARRLHNWGAKVQVLLAQAPKQMTSVAAHQLEILIRMGVEWFAQPILPHSGRRPDLIIDGLVGYSLDGAPHGLVRQLIEWSNTKKSPILALDVPSGVNATTGTVFDSSINASATMCLALPKEGLRATGIDAQVGELYLADIGVPPELYSRLALGFKIRPIFSSADVLRLW